MLQAIGELLSSKKFLMMLIGVIVWFAGRYGINLDPATLYPPLAIIVAGIFGQAIADHGKSAAQITAARPDPVQQMAAAVAQSSAALYGTPPPPLDPIAGMPPVAPPLVSVPPPPKKETT